MTDLDVMKPYRILALDGGPSPVTYLRALYKLEQHSLVHHNVSLLNQVDMFAGTSGGSVAALYLASTAPPKDGRKDDPCSKQLTSLERIRNCIDLIDAFYTKFFKPPLGNIVGSALGLRSLVDVHPLVEIMNRYFPDNAERTLGSLPVDVCLMSYQVRTPMHVRILHNFDVPSLPTEADPLLQNLLDTQTVQSAFSDSKKQRSYTVRDTILRSSGFPLFMPVHNGCIDGGFFANNPSFCALTTYLFSDYLRGHVEKPFESLNKLSLLSFGGQSQQFASGIAKRKLNNNSVSWGWPFWIINPRFPLLLFETIIDANVQGSQQSTEQILGNRSFRLAYTGGTHGLASTLIDNFFSSPSAIREKARDAVESWRHPSRYESYPYFTHSWFHTMFWLENFWFPQSPEAITTPDKQGSAS